MIQRIIYLVCSFLAFVQGVNAQFLWEETHPSSKDKVCYVYNPSVSISTFGDVISVMGHIYDSTQIPQEIVAYHVSRSDDDGKTWTEHPLPLQKQNNQSTFNFFLEDIHQVNSSHCVVIAYDYRKDSAIYLHTFDSGKTWSRVNFSDSGGIVAIHFSDSLTGALVMNEKDGVNPTIYTTSDGGMNFTKIVKIFDNVGFINIASRGEGKFCGFQAGSGRIFSNLISSDNIDSTSPIVDIDVLPLYWFRGCEFSGDTIVAFGSYSSDGTFDIQKTEGTVARSSDRGKSWVTQRFPQFYMLFSSTIPSKDTIIVVGGSFLQKPMYLFSTDNGITWRTDTLRVDSGFVERIEDIKITDNGTPIAVTRTVFAGGAPTIIARGKHTPSSVKPNRNSNGISIYPNPATTSLQIVSATPNSTIKLIDALGRTVMTQASTDGETTLDVSKLSRGMYQVLIGNSVGKILLTN